MELACALCHSLPSTVAVKRRQIPDSLSKTKLTVHLIRVGSISKLSAGCIVTPRSMHGITSLESRSILSAKYPNLATCLTFTYYHLRCQERVGLVNHTRPFLSAGAYTASDNALR